MKMNACPLTSLSSSGHREIDLCARSCACLLVCVFVCVGVCLRVCLRLCLCLSIFRFLSRSLSFSQSFSPFCLFLSFCLSLLCSLSGSLSLSLCVSESLCLCVTIIYIYGEAHPTQERWHGISVQGHTLSDMTRLPVTCLIYNDATHAQTKDKRKCKKRFLLLYTHTSMFYTHPLGGGKMYIYIYVYIFKSIYIHTYTWISYTYTDTRI